jgi:putative chitinase
MSVTFSAYEWLQLIGLGGFSGMLGQGSRAVIGFKKLHDASSGTTGGVADMIAADRLIVSLVIGFIAGALAAISTIQTAHDLLNVGLEQVLGFAGAGYAGADFIEGLISRVAPAANVPAGQEAVGSGAASPAQADGSVG